MPSSHLLQWLCIHQYILPSCCVFSFQRLHKEVGTLLQKRAPDKQTGRQRTLMPSCAGCSLPEQTLQRSPTENVLKNHVVEGLGVGGQDGGKAEGRTEIELELEKWTERSPGNQLLMAAVAVTVMAFGVFELVSPVIIFYNLSYLQSSICTCCSC